MDIIEAVWAQPDRERNQRQPKSKELWELLEEAIICDTSYQKIMF